jgi:hypothetical protein
MLGGYVDHLTEVEVMLGGSGLHASQNTVACRHPTCLVITFGLIWQIAGGLKPLQRLPHFVEKHFRCVLARRASLTRRLDVLCLFDHVGSIGTGLALTGLCGLISDLMVEPRVALLTRDFWLLCWEFNSLIRAAVLWLVPMILQRPFAISAR